MKYTNNIEISITMKYSLHYLLNMRDGKEGRGFLLYQYNN